ncbi:unnamed protein product, partial [Closterium sp. NIES-65]
MQRFEVCGRTGGESPLWVDELRDGVTVFESPQMGGGASTVQQPEACGRTGGKSPPWMDELRDGVTLGEDVEGRYDVACRDSEDWWGGEEWRGGEERRGGEEGRVGVSDCGEGRAAGLEGNTEGGMESGAGGWRGRNNLPRWEEGAILEGCEGLNAVPGIDGRSGAGRSGREESNLGVAQKGGRRGRNGSSSGADKGAAESESMRRKEMERGKREAERERKKQEKAALAEEKKRKKQVVQEERLGKERAQREVQERRGAVWEVEGWEKGRDAVSKATTLIDDRMPKDALAPQKGVRKGGGGVGEKGRDAVSKATTLIDNRMLKDALLALERTLSDRGYPFTITRNPVPASLLWLLRHLKSPLPLPLTPPASRFFPSAAALERTLSDRNPVPASLLWLLRHLKSPLPLPLTPPASRFFPSAAALERTLSDRRYPFTITRNPLCIRQQWAAGMVVVMGGECLVDLLQRGVL